MRHQSARLPRGALRSTARWGCRKRDSKGAPRGLSSNIFHFKKILVRLFASWCSLADAAGRSRHVASRRSSFSVHGAGRRKESEANEKSRRAIRRRASPPPPRVAPPPCARGGGSHLAGARRVRRCSALRPALGVRSRGPRGRPREGRRSHSSLKNTFPWDFWSCVVVSVLHGTERE